MQCDCRGLCHCEYSCVDGILDFEQQAAIQHGLFCESAIDGLTHKAQLFADLRIALDTVSAPAANNAAVSDHAVSDAKRRNRTAGLSHHAREFMARSRRAS